MKINSVVRMGATLSTAGEDLIEKLFGFLPSEGPQDVRGPCSIFTRLEPLFSCSDEELDPNPVINSALSDLVALLQGSESALGKRGASKLFGSLQEEVCNEIDGRCELQQRASAIREIATRAESRLELYYARLLLETKPVLMDKHRSRVERVREASYPFPYVENYVTMVDKESQVLRRLVCERKGMGSPRAVHVQSVENRMEETCDDEMWVAFCGSGALPLTGIVMTAFANVRVTLIDVDEEAVSVSRALIKKWESEDVIERGRINVIHGDAADMVFDGRWGRSRGGMRVDVVFIAALIENEVKERMFRALASRKYEAPLVVLRTAHGLTARLAYFESCRERLCEYMRMIAVVVPRTHVREDGGVVDEREGDLRVELFDRRILNSLEVYEWDG